MTGVVRVVVRIAGTKTFANTTRCSVNESAWIVTNRPAPESPFRVFPVRHHSRASCEVERVLHAVHLHHARPGPPASLTTSSQSRLKSRLRAVPGRSISCRSSRSAKNGPICSCSSTGKCCRCKRSGSSGFSFSKRSSSEFSERNVLNSAKVFRSNTSIRFRKPGGKERSFPSGLQSSSTASGSLKSACTCQALSN